MEHRCCPLLRALVVLAVVRHSSPEGVHGACSVKVGPPDVGLPVGGEYHHATGPVAVSSFLGDVRLFRVADAEDVSEGEVPGVEVVEPEAVLAVVSVEPDLVVLEGWSVAVLLGPSLRNPVGLAGSSWADQNDDDALLGFSSDAHCLLKFHDATVVLDELDGESLGHIRNARPLDKHGVGDSFEVMARSRAAVGSPLSKLEGSFDSGSLLSAVRARLVSRSSSLGGVPLSHSKSDKLRYSSPSLRSLELDVEVPM